MAKATKDPSERQMMSEKDLARAAALVADVKKLRAEIEVLKKKENLVSFSLMFKNTHLKLSDKDKTALRDLAVSLVESKIKEIEAALLEMGVKV